MKKILLLFVVGIYSLTNPAFAQEFKLFMTLDYSQNTIKTFNMKSLSNGVYGTGVFTGTAPSPNGQSVGYNGIIFFPNGNLTQPTTVGGGIPTQPGNGVYDITEVNSNLWAVAEGSDGGKLYIHDIETNTWTNRGITADTMIKFIEQINDTMLLLIGPMKQVNGLTVNGICTYNTETGLVAKVGNGFTNPFNVPNYTYRSDDGQVCIAGRGGISLYDTRDQTFQEVLAPGMGTYQGFIAHGDTMYVTGPDNVGSSVYRKIQNSPWELLGFTITGTGGGLVKIDDYIYYLTASSKLTTNTGDVIPGSDFRFNPNMGSFEKSPFSNTGGIVKFMKLPNGEYLGWNLMGNLETTQSLVSVVEITDEQIRMFPNPSPQGGDVMIENIVIGTQIVVTNSIGQTILNEKTSSERFVFNTKDMPRGIYFVNKTKLIIQ